MNSVDGPVKPEPIPPMVQVFQFRITSVPAPGPCPSKTQGCPAPCISSVSAWVPK